MTENLIGSTDVGLTVNKVWFSFSRLPGFFFVSSKRLISFFIISDQTFSCVGIFSWTLQARNQLGTPGGTKSFPRVAKFFKLCRILSKYVQQIFPKGRKVF